MVRRRSLGWTGATLGVVTTLVACGELIGLAPFEKGPFPPEGGVDAQADASCPNDSGNCAKGCEGVAVGDSGVCIDRIEVTVRAYDEFVKNGPKAFTRPARCSGAIPLPKDFALQLGALELPVRGVDWCSANAYCIWRGKHLCGGIGGAVIDEQTFTDPTKDEWMAACSGPAGGDRIAYPYGSTYQPTRCNGLDQQRGGPWDAGSSEDCKTLGFAVYDLSGNVAEWEDACDEIDRTTRCRIRGGSFASDAGNLRCTAREARPPELQSLELGFRCCE